MKKMIIIGAWILMYATTAFAQNNYQDEHAKWEKQIRDANRQADQADRESQRRIDQKIRDREYKEHDRQMLREYINGTNPSKQY